jgi:hypothetical protein
MMDGWRGSWKGGGRNGGERKLSLILFFRSMKWEMDDWAISRINESTKIQPEKGGNVETWRRR